MPVTVTATAITIKTKIGIFDCCVSQACLVHSCTRRIPLCSLWPVSSDYYYTKVSCLDLVVGLESHERRVVDEQSEFKSLFKDIYLLVTGFLRLKDTYRILPNFTLEIPRQVVH